MENQLSVTLKNNELFKDIDFDKINLDEIKGTLSTLTEGEILYREGSPAKFIYFIVSGEVNLLKKSDVGKTKSFIFSENEFVGHDEFLDNRNRVSTVVALQDAYLIGLSRNEIENLLAQDGQIISTLKSFCLEDLHTEQPHPTENIDSEIQNTFNSDINLAEPQEEEKPESNNIDTKIDDTSSSIIEEEPEQSSEISTEDEEEKSNPEDETSFSFDSLHSEIEQFPTEQVANYQTQEGMSSNVSYPDEMFSLDDLDESSIHDTVDENVLNFNSTEDIQPISSNKETVQSQFEELSETPLNKNIENFESPNEYADETNDVEFNIAKTEPEDILITEPDNALLFLNEDSEDDPTTKEKEVFGEESPDDMYLNGIDSENENTITDEKDEFPSEFNIVEESMPVQTNLDESFSLDKLEDAQINSTEEKTSDDETSSNYFNGTISFEEPEIKINDEPSNSSGDDFTPTDETTETEQINEINLQFEETLENTPPLEEDLILDAIHVETVPAQTEETLSEATENVIEPQATVSDIKLETDEPNLSPSQLKMIIKAAELVNSNLKIDDLLVNIVDVAANLIDADRGTIYIVENEKNELWSKVATGNEVKEYHLKIGEGIAGWVAQSGEIVNINNAQEDERFNNEYDKASGYTTKSMLCFPIKNKEGIIVGVIQLLNSHHDIFTQLDEEILNAISIHIALALEKATLVEQLLQGERISSLGKMANFLIQDIKKPVLVSKRYADHLREKDLPADIIQVLEMMTDQLNHVADIVQTTSSYSQGNVILRTVNTKVNELLDDFVNRIDSYIRTKNCQIVKEFATDATIKIDVKEFYQCFNHVIKNACDAMPDGGNIIVSTKLDDDIVTITFKDNGLGISESLKEKVFEPFMSHGKREGTGLGLSITKKVVEDHGGSIEIDSILGDGATIIIKLQAISEY